MTRAGIYGLGLISLLNGCFPNTSITYMGKETNSLETSIYVLSDRDNKIKREILDANEEVGLPLDIRDRLMLEADKCGLPVKVESLIDETRIMISFPMVYAREWMDEYLIRGYFVKKVEFRDEGNDCTLDGLNENGRKIFRNTIEAAEDVLREHNEK